LSTGARIEIASAANARYAPMRMSFAKKASAPSEKPMSFAKKASAPSEKPVRVT